MKTVPHPHRCLCRHQWDCMNESCTDIEYQWCKLPGCDRPEALRRTSKLETIAHMVHQVEHYLRTAEESVLAEQAATLRVGILTRVELLADELFAAEGIQRRSLGGAPFTPDVQ